MELPATRMRPWPWSFGVEAARWPTSDIRRPGCFGRHGVWSARSELLRNKGYEVHGVRDGLAGLQIIWKNTPD